MRLYNRLAPAVLCAAGAALGQAPDKLPEPAAGEKPRETLAAPAPAAPLLLDEVLASVEAYFPLLTAAEQERVIAAGQVITAQGAFDLNLSVQQYNAPPGNTFENYRFNAGLSQYTGLGGSSFTAGYRNGQGQFPVYYGDRKTGDGGEFRAAATIPLLRDNEIDRRRANLAQAGINRQIAEPLVRRQRLDAQRAASRAYWGWVAAVQRARVARRLLDVAKDRDAGLQGRVEAGALAKIDRTDNLRTIAEREARLVIAERREQAAAIELSLYLRDPKGCPTVPPPWRVPDFPEPVPVDAAKACEAAELAWANRPEIERLRLTRERIAVELRWAANQTLPSLSANFVAARDVGQANKFDGTPKSKLFDTDEANLEANLLFEVPVQRRDARGRVLTAQAQIAQVAEQERYARDQIAVEVRDLLSALERAFALRGRAQEAVRLAREVVEGERAKLDAGTSTILNVNLRELTAFESELTLIDALAEYFRAFTDYKAALGYDATAPKPGG